MYFMSKEVLTTQFLAKSVATITCDVIATQCGANKFVSTHDHVELMGLRNVRFLAGSEVYSTSTLSYQLENGQFVHKELMQLMVNYARHYSHEAQDSAVLEVLAMLATLGTDRDGWISTFFQEISELSTSTIVMIVLFIVILLFAFDHYMRGRK